MDVLSRFFLISNPLSDSVCCVLYEALVHLLLVQLDNGVIDVAGALWEDISLVGQEGERDVVDI